MSLNEEWNALDHKYMGDNPARMTRLQHVSLGHRLDPQYYYEAAFQDYHGTDPAGNVVWDLPPEFQNQWLKDHHLAHEQSHVQHVHGSWFVQGYPVDFKANVDRAMGTVWLETGNKYVEWEFKNKIKEKNWHEMEARGVIGQLAEGFMPSCYSDFSVYLSLFFNGDRDSKDWKAGMTESEKEMSRVMTQLMYYTSFNLVEQLLKECGRDTMKVWCYALASGSDIDQADKTPWMTSADTALAFHKANQTLYDHYHKAFGFRRYRTIPKTQYHFPLGQFIGERFSVLRMYADALKRKISRFETGKPKIEWVD